MTAAGPVPSTGRIENLFAGCRAEDRAALVIFITAGYPDAATTAELLPVLEEAGCDLIELGIPFSDPIADGPVIQRSSTIALERGMTLPGTMDLLADFRRGSQLPVVLFGSLNPFMARGLEKSAARAEEAGADGILAADLPQDEAAEFAAILRRHRLHLITLVAPTTPPERIRHLAGNSTGFLYCVSMKGVTGTATGIDSSVQAYIDRIRGETDLPLALGFGISEPDHVRQAVSTGVDGVVVGSALIRTIGNALDEGRDVKKSVHDYVRGLATALKKS